MKKLILFGTLFFLIGQGSAFGAGDLIVDGKLGVGTTSPTETVDVVGNIKASGTICDGNGCIGDADTFAEGVAIPVTWTNLSGVSASGNTLTRTASVGPWEISGAVSEQNIYSDGYMEFQCPSGFNHVMAGLSNGDTNQHYNDIDFAIYCNNNVISIYESGTSRGNFSSYLPSDLFRIGVSSNVVTYYKSGTLLYTSMVTPTLPLLVDTSLLEYGDTINDVVIFDSVAYFSNGNVGIGTSTPTEALDVVGNVNATGNMTAGGNVTATGNVTAAAFIGDGSGLTNISSAALPADIAFKTDGINQTFDSGTLHIDAVNNRVGVGTMTPNNKLQVEGLINFDPVNHSTSLGESAGGGVDSTAVGYMSLNSNTTGHSNTATGISVLEANTTGYNNTASGVRALKLNTTGHDNTAIGVTALYLNTSGSNNTAIGKSALISNTTGMDNTATGFQALYSNTTGYRNTANGENSLVTNTTGNYNTATGFNALRVNSTGINNTANGSGALYSNTVGYNNTAYGYEALQVNATGNNNTATGLRSGFNNISGSGNVFLGYLSGYNETGSNKLYIENSNSGSPLIYGEFDNNIVEVNGRVGIGMTPDALYDLDVNGDIRAAAVYETSDNRVKKNVKPIGTALDKVKMIGGYSYDFDKEKYPNRNFPKGKQYGLIAQEVESVIPELVKTDSNGEKSISYTKMVPFLVEAIKEQQEMIDKGLKPGEGDAAWESQEGGDLVFNSGSLHVGSNDSPSDLSVTGKVGLNSEPSDSYQVTIKGTQVGEKDGVDYQRGLQVEVSPDSSKWTEAENHVSGIDTNVVADEKLGDEILETQVGINIKYGADSTASASSVVQNAYGLKVEPSHAGGQVDNSYGVYIGSPEEGGVVTNSWGIFQAHNDTKNYFAGSVGIGVEEPAYKLDVDGDIKVSGQIFSTGTPITSDLRLKEDVKTLDGALAQVLKLRGVNYDWKEGVSSADSKRQIGFIAQEVEAVYPALVSTGKNGHKAVDYARLMPAVVEAVKAQQAQIESQQTQIKALKTENATIKAEKQTIEKRLGELEMMKLRMAQLEATLANFGPIATLQGKVVEE